jgi:hypothetical protein
MNRPWSRKPLLIGMDEENLFDLFVLEESLKEDFPKKVTPQRRPRE